MDLANDCNDTSGDRIRDTPLHLAIRENQPEAFNLLLEESNLNARNQNGETSLHYAALHNRPEFAKTLIDNGAIVNVIDLCSRTPLDVALEVENVKVAEVLFKHGAVISDYDLKYMGPLRSAVRKGNFELVKLLMANGCNKVDVPKDDASYIESSLKFAVSSDRLDILEYLIMNGVKSSATVNQDKLHLFTAIASGYGSLATLKYLVDLGFKTKAADSVFYTSMYINIYDVWQYLLKCFSKINAKTYFKEKQIHFSIRMGQVESVTTIVNEPRNKYKLNAFDRQLAVYIAAESGNGEILEILLNAHYPVDSLFKKTSPLHVAATFEHPRLVKLLLEAGADVNLQTEDGLTPLYFAACAAQPAVVKFLLENGADPSKPSKSSESPLQAALKLYSSIVSFKPISPLVFESLVKVTETLIRCSKTEDGKGLLPYAVRIRVANNNNSNLESKEIISDPRDSEFRPEIIRCLFNYLSDELVEYISEIVVNKSFPVEQTPELFHLLMEYNDFNWCFHIRIDDVENKYKCQVLLTSYSRNIDNLLYTAKHIIWYKDGNIYKESEIDGQIVFLKLIVSRLVLLATNCYLPFIEFCLENDLNDWRDKCLKEEVDMKNTKINENMIVTFYDVLTKSTNEVAMYASNCDFLKAIESSDKKFPIYADFLKVNAEIAERRRHFINDCVSLMLNLVQNCHRVRISTAEINGIFKYLSIVDLRRFSAAFF
ncbi:putative ankyrin repeat protein RF_0381 isoform X2 [Leptopilina heterotoma]|uniref:putative ankyrin repeat protein RF_0381 isoform X2 n=1 Tax=Leptopilina heterotoma TaxID=63436 RepID=UPI001CAA274D|nr:putative ankyrin repeat protein RF_0381 isoform X2 [Leptopilina heterotoma]